MYHVFSHIFCILRQDFSNEEMEYADFGVVHLFKKILLVFALMAFSTEVHHCPLILVLLLWGFLFFFPVDIFQIKIVKHIKFVMYAVTVLDD